MELRSPPGVQFWPVALVTCFCLSYWKVWKLAYHDSHKRQLILLALVLVLHLLWHSHWPATFPVPCGYHWPNDADPHQPRMISSAQLTAGQQLKILKGRFESGNHKTNLDSGCDLLLLSSLCSSIFFTQPCIKHHSHIDDQTLTWWSKLMRSWTFQCLQVKSQFLATLSLLVKHVNSLSCEVMGCGWPPLRRPTGNGPRHGTKRAAGFTKRIGGWYHSPEMFSHEMAWYWTFALVQERFDGWLFEM